MNRLIMPKQSGQLDVFFESLAIYYEAYQQGEESVLNSDYKIEIQRRVPRLTSGAVDGAFLVKQSEITRYFGLVFYDYTGNRAYITKKGIEFYESYLNHDKNKQLDILFESIMNISFGRNNTGIKNSNSNIDPPKLFLKASYDLDGITNKEFSYLLYLVNDKEFFYGDSCMEVKSNCYAMEIPEENKNKYSDLKFLAFFDNIGFIKTVKHKRYLCDYIKNKYKNDIINMSIYNTEPEYIYTFNTDENEDIQKHVNSIIRIIPYDVDSEVFNQLNNRKPEMKINAPTKRYKTNSRISKTAINLRDYKCEVDNNHISFISKSNEIYMEPHHLIPMNAQDDFDINLDRIENIICLCPLCHKAIHYGSKEVRMNLVRKLFEARKQKLFEIGIKISFDELFKKYYK